MKIEQMYTGCLSQIAYYVESAGEAAIIDPLRESAPYIEKAKKEGATIKYIFETHFHADFVSGHVDLAARTGAKIVYGQGAKAEYAIHEAGDGEIFELGEVSFKVLQTPGHTLESVIFLLLDENGKEHAIFSGDTLFIGDVGRPDLVQIGTLTRRDLAGMLYDSLREKVFPLPDDVIVYPAHGAGSACGKNMRKETTDLLGNQKKTNYALRAEMTKEAFIEEITEGLLPPPQYFAQNVAMNKAGAVGLHKILEKGKVLLDAEAFESALEEAIVLDTRQPQAFARQHIPNSIFIGIDGNFAPWVGALISNLQQPIVFVADCGREEEVITRLARVGYDHTLGYLKGGISAWITANKDTDSVKSISADEFAELYQNNKLNVVDVRKPSEYKTEHVPCAKNLPLDFISENMDKIDKAQTYYIHCLSGYRSMIASSILKSRGYHDVIDVAGGIKAIAKTSLPLQRASIMPSHVQ